MKRITYCSQATDDVAPDELVALLELARRANEQAGLTGMLLYCSQSFLQVLEGDEDALEATYAGLAALHDGAREVMLENRFMLRDGSAVHLRWVARPLARLWTGVGGLSSGVLRARPW